MNPSSTTGIAPVNASALPPYAPTTYVDFSKPEHRAAFETALADVRASSAARCPR
jgi:hypothetical protein